MTFFSSIRQSKEVAQTSKPLVKSINSVESAEKVAAYKNFITPFHVADLQAWKEKIQSTITDLKKGKFIKKHFYPVNEEITEQQSDYSVVDRFVQQLKSFLRFHTKATDPNSEESVREQLEKLDLSSHTPNLKKRIETISDRLSLLSKVHHFEKKAASSPHVDLKVEETAEYIRSLKEIIEEEGDPDECQDVTLLQLKGEPRETKIKALPIDTTTDPKVSSMQNFVLIDLTGEYRTKGSFGEIRQHEVYKISSSPDKPSTMQKEYYASKRDLNGQDSVKEEIEVLKNLSKRLPPEDREKMMRLIAYQEGILFTDLYEEGDLVPCFKEKEMKVKNEVFQNIIEQLDILLRNDLLVLDLKPANMIYKKTESGTKAILCDLVSLIDLKAIIENPTDENLDKMRDALKKSTPSHVPISESNSIMKEITKLENLDMQDRTPAAFASLRYQTQQLMKFAIGSSFHRYFTGQRPYPDVYCNTLPDCPSILLQNPEYTTQVPKSYIGNAYYLNDKKDMLNAMGCAHTSTLMKLIDPDLAKRTTT